MKAQSKGTVLGTSAWVGLAFLIVGVLSLVISVFINSQILAFVGLGLTFWGALFIIITPTRYVESSLLNSTITASYTTTDRIITDLNYSGKAYYIPPYPKTVSIPDHLKALKDPVVFIPAQDSTQLPSIEEISKGKFLIKNPDGILITPPGAGLLEQLKKRMRLDFTKTSIAELCEALPREIINKFSLAKEIELAQTESRINLKITNSAYNNLFNKESNLRSVSLLGCPITSAIACALAEASGKRITIEKLQATPENSTIEATYRIIEG